jgi:hypothetical protein
MTQQNAQAATPERPSRRLQLTFEITPALVRDVAQILLQQGWEISVSSALPQAQAILERVKAELDAAPVQASLPEPQPVKETWVDSDPLKMKGKPCDCGRSYCKRIAGEDYPGVCQEEDE